MWKPKSTSQKVCMGLAITSILLLISLLIAYRVRLGTGNELHTLGTLGTCTARAADASLKITTFNLFLIECTPFSVRCQEESNREIRVGEIAKWFSEREEDVVLFQEVWSFHDELRDGMSNAAYCHYIISTRSAGSGLAIFSKYPIIKQDYRDWFDAFGKGESMSPEQSNFEAFFADKGVLYAKILKDDTPIHVFNMHTNSDTNGDHHDVRVGQFRMVRNFIDLQQIPTNEIVFMGGDLNEDPDCRMRRCEMVAKCENREYYNEMLDVLNASPLETVGDGNFTYDTEVNRLLKELYAGDDCDYYQYRLDYIFIDQKHLIPEDSSSCKVLNPAASDGSDLSDHLPLACTFIGIGAAGASDAGAAKN